MRLAALVAALLAPAAPAPGRGHRVRKLLLHVAKELAALRVDLDLLGAQRRLFLVKLGAFPRQACVRTSVYG